MFTMRNRLLATLIALALFATQVVPAFACGGLIAPDGDVRLARASTFVAWHDGIERYLTSFSYQGDISNLGWIVPLPAVPLKIEAGGAWTLQRLDRETHPEPVIFAAGAVQSSSKSVDVLQQVKIEALNITVIRGSGDAVLQWATSNGFAVSGDTSAHLLAYAKASPIFMAAKYDTAAAKARGQLQGDGAPILITMKIEHLWVPLEILALDGQQVHADLYLLTDHQIYASDHSASMGISAVNTELPGAPGFKVAYQAKLNNSLYHDLSTDRNMSWVWPDSWLTYLSLDAPDTAVTYDLGISSQNVIRLAPFGSAPMAIFKGNTSQIFPLWVPPTALALLGLLGVGGTLFLFLRKRI